MSVRPSPIETPKVAVGHLGAAVRSGDPAKIREARSGLATSNIAAAIGRELAGEVELTESQTAELVSILRGGQR
jgi:hypothetical protein